MSGWTNNTSMPRWVKITRPGMRPLYGQRTFSCPNYTVVVINGTERLLDAVEGRVTGFTLTPWHPPMR